MIVEIPLVLALVVCIKDVSSASFSKVFFQNGRDYPYEHVQYSAPSYSYSPHIAKLTAAPISQVLPYSANYVPYTHPSSIYEYPEHVASIAPSAKYVQYQNVPLVVSPQSDLAGYQYSYVVYDDHKAHLESSEDPAAHGGYSFIQPEGFNTYVKTYVSSAEHEHAGHSAAAPCHENEHLTAHVHHESHHVKSESSGESEEPSHGSHHASTHESHESHGHESHHEDHGHDHLHENHESHGHEGREETEHPHNLDHEGHDGSEHESHEGHDHTHDGHDQPDHGHEHGTSSSSGEHGSHEEHGDGHDHEEHHGHEGHEKAHGRGEHEGSHESVEVEHHGNHHAEAIHEKHASYPEEMSSESLESEVHDLVASRNIEHSNVLVPYNGVIKCVQAAMHGARELSQPHHPESPLTYIVLNKPC